MNELITFGEKAILLLISDIDFEGFIAALHDIVP